MNLVAAATSAPTHEALEAHNWGLVIAFVVMLIPFAIWRGIWVGKDGPLSASKTIAAVWTYVVASPLLAAVIAWLIGHHQALDATKSVSDYAILFGGPLGAAILAKQIRVAQLNKAAAAAAAAAPPGAPAPAPGAPAPALSDLVKSPDGDDDLGNLQYLLFNIVALVYVIGSLVQHPTHGLPNIPDVLVGLTSVSAVGYVAKKALGAAPGSTPGALG